MRAKYKNQRAQFEKLVDDLLLSLGAIRQVSSDPWPVYKLDTSVGELRLSIHTELWCCNKSWFSHTGSPWVAGRFENVKGAYQLTGCESNTFSGKWNHHYWTGWTEDFGPGLDRLRREILRVTGKPEQETA